MSSTSQYLSVANGHIDSLIKYVVDVKPYHVKLSEIVEQYLFEESIKVTIGESHAFTTFLGPDILPNSETTPGVRRRRSDSWNKNTISDGSRRTWPVTITSVNKLANQTSREKFSATDSITINGFPTSGVFSLVRWDGDSITDVRKNDQHQHDSVDYFLSHGAFSLDVRSGGRWKETQHQDISAFGINQGMLFYTDLVTEYGTVSNIVNGNYEEWTLTCVSVDPVICDVTGSYSGTIGQVQQMNSFIDSRISFDFKFTENSLDAAPEIGYKFTLTPFNKITVAPDAVEETWSLIKTNPEILLSAPIFTSSTTRSTTPALKIHTRSLDRVSEEATYTVVFGTDGSYTVNKSSASESYSQTENLINGCSFKNDDIHFSIIAENESFAPGDAFSFSTLDKAFNYQVYGTVSGWSTPAKIGEWYWNGSIGFKIPQLEYFVDTYNSTIISSEFGLQDEWATIINNNQILTSVSFNANTFITTGDNQIVGASANGKIWTSDLPSVINANNEIIIITGENGTVATSSDSGATWISQESHTTANLNASTFIPNFLSSPSGMLNCIIVVGNNGTILTSINGSGWADQNSNTTKNLNGIVWTDDAIIVVGDNGTILRSEDRVIWESLNSNTLNNLTDIIVDSLGNFIAVGENGTILRSTNNGDTWIPVGGFTDGTINSIAFGNNTYVAVGQDGWTYTSPDSIIWDRYRSKRLNDIAFGNGKFVAVGGRSIDTALFTELKKVHSIAEPSVYTIKFISSTNATVSNNIYGHRRGLVVGEDWFDEFVSFRLDSISGQYEYQQGDEIRVYLTPMTSFTVPNSYDRFQYDESKYDTSLATLTVPLLFCEELFPLYHGHGAVIFKNVNSSDNFIIDLATKDKLLFKIFSPSSLHPELARFNNNVPLELRYFDKVTNGSPSSTAHFPDLSTVIEAYLCSDPSVRVFSISQPRLCGTDRNESATLTFDEDFFSKYLPFNTAYSLTFLTDQSYGQTIRVKISEKLKTYARVKLIFDDIVIINIDDSPIQHFNIAGELSFIDSANISFIEGGSLPYPIAYDQFPYDVFPYDLPRVNNGVLFGVTETDPGVFEWTGGDNWVITKPTTSPSIFVSEEVDENVASTGIVEGLSIEERVVGQPAVISRLSIYFDNDIYSTEPMLVSKIADEYLITHNGQVSSPTVVIESTDDLGNYHQIIPNMQPFTQHPGAISLKSFSFTLPANVTAPFKLTIT